MIVGYDQVFMAEAEACLERSRRGADSGDPTARAGASASAILASCMAAEAFVSERASYHLQRGSISEEAAEQIRTADGLYRKLNALTKCFEDEGIDRHERYAQFCALCRLRGHVAHRFARYLSTDDWPEGLADQAGLIPHNDGPGLDWTSRVLNEVTAAWAVATVGQILEEASKYVPEPPHGIIVAAPTIEVMGRLVLPGLEASGRGTVGGEI